MINKIKINEILHHCILSFAFFPLVPNKIKGILVILLLFFSIVYFLRNKKRKLNFKMFFINSILFFIYLASLFYTQNMDRAISVLSETRLSAFVIPLAFLLISDNKNLFSTKLKISFINLFVWSTFIFSTIFFLYLPFKSQEFNPFFQFPSVFYFRNGLMEIPLIGIEPIYGSIYLSISILLTSVGLFTYKRNKPFKIFLVLFFFSIIILLGSKMALLALFVIAGITLFSSSKISLKKKALYTIVIIFIILGAIRLPTLNQRAKELLTKETYTEYKRNNSTSTRLTIFRCSFETVREQFIFGVGVGDVEDELLNCYDKISFDLVEKNYNTHNQYLSILLGTGFIGLIAFLFFLYYTTMLFYKTNQFEIFLVLIFFIISFISENILERQNGIILFYFITCFFSTLNEKKS